MPELVRGYVLEIHFSRLSAARPVVIHVVKDLVPFHELAPGRRTPEIAPDDRYRDRVVVSDVAEIDLVLSIRSFHIRFERIACERALAEYVLGCRILPFGYV